MGEDRVRFSWCPKCGHTGHGWFSGPVYDAGESCGGEHLRYYCKRCRYGWREDVHDKPKPKE